MDVALRGAEFRNAGVLAGWAESVLALGGGGDAAGSAAETATLHCSAQGRAREEAG